MLGNVRNTKNILLFAVFSAQIFFTQFFESPPFQGAKEEGGRRQGGSLNNDQNICF